MCVCVCVCESVCVCVCVCVCVINTGLKNDHAASMMNSCKIFHLHEQRSDRNALSVSCFICIFGNILKV